jgi:BirA family biotin operon repressor/biotin-[acetyl-CoA-carboxylase] ligase
MYCNWLLGEVESKIVPYLPIIAAVAAHEAVAGVGIRHLSTKWPNDLLVNGKKIAGILVHCRHADTVLATVGLGVNIVASPNLDDPSAAHPPTSVLEVVRNADATEAASRIAAGLVDGMRRGLIDPHAAVATWKSQLVHREGEQMTVRTASGDLVQGLFGGVTSEGHVRITTDDGERTLSGGDIVEE